MTKQIHSAEKKSKVAIEAIKGEITLGEVAKKYSVHPRQVQNWKNEVLSNVKGIFELGGKVDTSKDKHLETLERKIGQLLIENDFLKKNYSMWEQRRGNK